MAKARCVSEPTGQNTARLFQLPKLGDDMSNLKRLRGPLAIIFGLMLAALMLWGQTETGQISGTIQDASGAVVPNVAVAAKNVATGVQRATATNTSGVYVLPNLRPGDWEITIS